MTPRTLLRRALVLAGVVVLGVTGCTATAAQTTGTSDGAGVVGVALPSSADAAWSDAGEALTDELRSRGYRVDLQFAADDARTQGSQVQNMLTKGTDAIVLAPLNAAEEIGGPLQSAADDGVPVVAIGRSTALPGVDFVAAADPGAVGRAQADALLAALGVATAGDDSPPSDAANPDGGDTPDGAEPRGEETPPAQTRRVAVLAGVADDERNAQRYAAAYETLASAAATGEIEIVAGASLDAAAVADDVRDEEEKAAQRVDDLRAAEAPPTAVLLLGDAVTRGAVEALTAPPPVDATASPDPSASPAPSASGASAIDPPPIVAVGSGADDDTVSALRDGVLAATVVVDARALAIAAADAVEVLLADGVPDGPVPAETAGPPAFVAPPITVVTSEADRARDLQDGGAG